MKKIAFCLACVALVAIVALTDFEPIDAGTSSSGQQSMAAPKKSSVMGVTVQQDTD